MDTISDYLDDDGGGDKPKTVKPQVFEDMRPALDLTGDIAPLTPEETAVIESLDWKGEEQETHADLFADIDEFRLGSTKLVSIIERMCDVRLDTERVDDEEKMGEMANQLREDLLAIFKGVEKTCDNREQFLRFATEFIFLDIDFRRDKLAELFDSEHLFVIPDQDSIYERLTEDASVKHLPSYAVSYYTERLFEDLRNAEKIIEDIQYKQDINIIKQQVLDIYRLLEQMRGEEDGGPGEGDESDES